MKIIYKWNCTPSRWSWFLLLEELILVSRVLVFIHSRNQGLPMLAMTCWKNSSIWFWLVSPLPISNHLIYFCGIWEVSDRISYKNWGSLRKATEGMGRTSKLPMSPCPMGRTRTRTGSTGIPSGSSHILRYFSAFSQTTLLFIADPV